MVGGHAVCSLGVGGWGLVAVAEVAFDVGTGTMVTVDTRSQTKQRTKQDTIETTIFAMMIPSKSGFDCINSMHYASSQTISTERIGDGRWISCCEGIIFS